MNKLMNRLGVIMVICLALILMAVTNPTKSDFDNWAKEQVSAQTSNSLAQGLIALLGTPVIDQVTQSKNYIVCSVYQTNVGDSKITTLGIFRNFFIVSKT